MMLYVSTTRNARLGSIVEQTQDTSVDQMRWIVNTRVTRGGQIAKYRGLMELGILGIVAKIAKESRETTSTRRVKEVYHVRLKSSIKTVRIHLVDTVQDAKPTTTVIIGVHRAHNDA